MPKTIWGKLWPKMESILKGISPALHLLVTTQIQAFEDQSDVKIRNDLLGSLGEEMVSISYLHKDNLELEELASPSSSIYAISLKDAKLFDRTMRAMVDSVSQGNELFEENEHRGVTIRSMRRFTRCWFIDFICHFRGLAFVVYGERPLYQASYQ